MTAYIANHQKKNRIFRKRERELRHAINSGLSEEKIVQAAEQLRNAKLAIYKAKFSKQSVLPAHSYSPENAANRDENVRRWMTMSANQIADTYRKRAQPR